LLFNRHALSGLISLWRLAISIFFVSLSEIVGYEKTEMMADAKKNAISLGYSWGLELSFSVSVITGLCFMHNQGPNSRS